MRNKLTKMEFKVTRIRKSSKGRFIIIANGWNNKKMSGQFKIKSHWIPLTKRKEKAEARSKRLLIAMVFFSEDPVLNK